MADQSTGDVVGKGKMVEVDDGCNGGGTSGGKSVRMFRGDVEHSHLPVWKDSAARRGGEYQFLKDAPLELSCLRQWLQSVEHFQEVTKFELPPYNKVAELAQEGWPGSWKRMALLQFQAVAHATGVMHPPRRKVSLASRKTPVKLRPVLALPALPKISMTDWCPDCRAKARVAPAPAPRPQDSELIRSPPPPVPVIVLQDLLPAALECHCLGTL